MIFKLILIIEPIISTKFVIKFESKCYVINISKIILEVCSLFMSTCIKVVHFDMEAMLLYKLIKPRQFRMHSQIQTRIVNYINIFSYITICKFRIMRYLWIRFICNKLLYAAHINNGLCFCFVVLNIFTRFVWLFNHTCHWIWLSRGKTYFFIF